MTVYFQFQIIKYFLLPAA